MTVNIVTSPKVLSRSTAPGIYLAGGWYGSSSWQQEAVEILREQPRDLDVFVPMLTENELTSADTIRTHFDWQNRHQRPGTVILFWFPKDVSFSTVPYTALAQLDMAIGHRMDFAAGVEEGFPYVDHVRSRKSMNKISQETRGTLTETIADALDYI